MKHIKFILLILTTLAIYSCTQDVNSSYENNNETQESNVEIETKSFKNLSSSTISGSWVRVGNSGTGKDISVRDIPYIIGDNNKIYYYDSSQNDWIREPGGGEGKMISQIRNDFTNEDILLLRGNNNKIYKKPMQVNQGWQVIVNNEVSSISGHTSAFSSENVFLFSSYSEEEPFEANGLSNPALSVFSTDFTPKFYPASYLRTNELIFTESGEYFAAGYRWQYYPCCYDNGDGIFKLTNGIWEEFGGKAIDIATGGPNDDIWIIGDDNKIYKLNQNDEWVPTSSGTGKRISVADDGTPYIIGGNNKIYKFSTN